MIDRVTLYSSDDLYVQREINRSLDTWIAEQRNLPDANPTQIAYADTLSSFYDWRYASRGDHVPQADLDPHHPLRAAGTRDGDGRREAQRDGIGVARPAVPGAAPAACRDESAWGSTNATSWD